MQSFRDDTGHAWTLDWTVSAMRRIRAIAGVNVDRPHQDDGAGLQGLAGDYVGCTSVLYAVAKPEADRLRVSEDAFGDRLLNLDSAALYRLILEGLADFFRRRDPQIAAGIDAGIAALTGPPEPTPAPEPTPTPTP